MYKVFKGNNEKWKDTPTLLGWDYLIVGDRFLRRKTTIKEDCGYVKKGDKLFEYDFEAIGLDLSDENENIKMEYFDIIDQEFWGEISSGTYDLVKVFDSIDYGIKFVTMHLLSEGGSNV